MVFDLLDYVRTQLNDRKGTWPIISDVADVPYDTLTKIAQGQTVDPGVHTVQKLADYFWALERKK